MDIVPDTVIDNQAVRLELEQLRADLATAREWLELEERKNERVRQEQVYEKRVFALDNQILSCTHKVIFLAVRAYVFSVRDVTQAVGDFVELPLWEIAKSTGLGREAVGAGLQRLHAVGLVERKQKQDRAEGGKIRTTIYVSLTLLSFSLELIPDETPKRNHGGDRQFCKHCGSDNLVKRTVIVCKSCGNNQDEPVETAVNPVDKIEEYVEVQEREKEDERKRKERDRRKADVECELEGKGKRKARLSLPTVPCALCERDKGKIFVSWGWNADEGEYCCHSCYSPFSATEKERARRREEEGVEWTPF